MTVKMILVIVLLVVLAALLGHVMPCPGSGIGGEYL